MAKSLGDKFKDALKQGVDKAGGSSINDFSKAVDNLYRNVSGVANLFRGSELVSTLLVRDQLSSTVFSSSTGWQISGNGTATFRSVTISGGSLLITNTTDRIYLQSDGDAFFGSDISAPATTSFSIFSNAQTYNSEAMGAGDILFGDNSSGKANLLWDASEGKILVRGGTTTAGYFNTTGAATFGAGNVILDADGIQLLAGTETVHILRWVDGSTNIFQFYASLAAGVTTATAHSYGSATAYNRLLAQGGTGGDLAYTSLRVTSTAAAAAHLLELYYSDGAGAENTIWNIDAVTGTMTLYTVAGNASLELYRTGAAVFNEDGADADLRVEGDTATNLLVCDAGLDAVRIGTTTAGVILDARSTGVIINDAGSSGIDFTVEGDTQTQLLWCDASADKVYYKGSEIGVAGAGGVSIWQVQMFS